jgi:putative transposase
MIVLLRRDRIVDNHKRIGCIYRAAGLQVRKPVRRKLALGRGPVKSVGLAPNERWSLDFVHDRLRTNRRFRVLAVGDDCTRENLALATKRWDKANGASAPTGRRSNAAFDAVRIASK